MKQLLLLAGVILTLSSCTENARVKQFGGSMTINIPPGNKVTNITWKNDEMWYSYRPFQENEKPSTTTFVEESSFGVWEGEVTFIETNSPTVTEEKNMYQILPDTSAHYLK